MGRRSLIGRERLEPGEACYQHGHIVQKTQGPCHGPTTRGSSQSWGQDGSLEAPRMKADLGWEVGDCLDLARG